MAYQAAHPVEVGAFGRFKYGGKDLGNLWIALEDLAYESAAGMYSARDVLRWAGYKGLLTIDEIQMVEKAL